MPTAVVSIGAGANHTLAIGSDGRAWSWGQNTYGQLGDGTQTQRTTPIEMAGVVGASRVAGGQYHSLIVLEDGTVHATGYNANGQLGDGTTTLRKTAVAVLGLSDVVAIGVGSSHSVALTAAGAIWTWGRNDQGQLGDGSGSQSLQPVGPVLTGIMAVAADRRTRSPCPPTPSHGPGATMGRGGSATAR